LSPHVRRLIATTATGLIAAAGIMAATTGPALAQETSKVSIVHGIPGQPVDVYVNGTRTLDNFQPATVAGPLDLAAGSYDIALTKPGDPISAAILTANDVAVPANRNLSVVAHLNTGGNPTLTAFVNDTSPIAAGEARLVVRHTAAAPAVDVRADGATVFTGLTNPNEDMTDVPAGSVSADVVLAGTTTVAIGPADLNLAEGTVTIVYAIGSADQNSLALVVQTISGVGSQPSGVPAGSAGLADSGTSQRSLAVLVVGGVLIVVGIARLTLVQRRRRAASPGR
jgi:hypothetical protein